MGGRSWRRRVGGVRRRGGCGIDRNTAADRSNVSVNDGGCAAPVPAAVRERAALAGGRSGGR